MRCFGHASRRAKDAELDEEIRAHLALAVADRIARGEAPDEALAAARREFGNVGLVKEVTRERWGAVGLWRERAAQDIRYAMRSLRRAPTYGAVAVLTLALGIGANAAMFTVVDSVLLRPLPFRSPAALFLVSHQPDGVPFLARPSMPDREYADYRRVTRVFEATTTYNTYPATLLGAGEPLRAATAGVTPSFLTTLGVRPRLGRGFTSIEDQPGANAVAIISAALWRERFGADTAAIGRSVSIEGYRKTIIGVMPDGFDFPARTQIWVPMAVTFHSLGFRMNPVIGRLATHATAPQALAELRAFVAREEREREGTRIEQAIATIVPLRDAIVGDVRRSLLVFAGAVSLVLLIACTNVSNLMLMRAATRRHELAIRIALGASRWRLVRQLLTESLIVALAGGVVGLGIAYGSVRLLLAAAPPDLLPRVTEIHIDPAVLGVMMVTCLATGVLAGTAPALAASRDPRGSLRDDGRTTGRARLRAIFVTVEVALAVVLLVGAGLLIRSFARLRSVDLGFTPAHVVSATVDFESTRYPTAELLHDVQRRLSELIAAIPGVHGSAAVNWVPLSRTTISGDFALEDGRPLPPNYAVLKPCVTPNYFETMGIRVRDGRGFVQTDDRAAARVAVVSASVARRFWPGQSAVGKRLTMADKPTAMDWWTIVGVVDDVAQSGVADARAEAVYRALAQVDEPPFINHLTFVARDTADPSAVAMAMRAAIRAIDPQQPVESIQTMETAVSATIAEPRFRSLLLATFSALALGLAAIGIYGVLAHVVSERIREIGIRLALGAEPSALARSVLVRTAFLTIPGVLLGIAVALGATRVLSAFLFHVDAADPVAFLAAALLLLVVALGAASAPAYRARRVDPLVVLRME